MDKCHFLSTVAVSSNIYTLSKYTHSLTRSLSVYTIQQRAATTKRKKEIKKKHTTHKTYQVFKIKLSAFDTSVDIVSVYICEILQRYILSSTCVLCPNIFGNYCNFSGVFIFGRNDSESTIVVVVFFFSCFF